jgi:hypothetical protein
MRPNSSTSSRLTFSFGERIMGERPEYNPYPTEETHQGGITKRLVVVIGFPRRRCRSPLLSSTWGVVDYRRALFLVSRTAMLSVVPKLIRTIIKPAPYDTACPGLAR